MMHGRTGAGLRRWLAVLAILAACVRPAAAAEPLLAADASSPAAVIRSFQAGTERVETLYAEYMADPSSAREVAIARTMADLSDQLFDLHEIPLAIRQKTGNAMVGYLLDILNRLAPIAPETLPGGAQGPKGELPPRWTIPGTPIHLVRVTEGPRVGDYLISAASVAQLASLHARIESLPPLRPTPVPNFIQAQQQFVGPWLARLPLHLLPAPLRAMVYGTPAWKLIGAMGVIALAGFLIVRWAGLVRRVARDKAAWRRHLWWLSVPLVMALLVQAGHTLILWQLVMSIEPSNVVSILATLALYAAAAWAAWRAFWLVAEAIIASPVFPDGIYDAHLMRIAARVGSLLAAGSILVYGANDIGVPALGLLAGVSIGGIAFALAAQSTVENLFGGISIFADRTFRVGDAIRFGTSTGTVEAIGPRSTRIRGVDGALTTVPNADLAKAQTTNISSRATSLFQHRLTIPGGVPSAQLERLLDAISARIAAHESVVRTQDTPRVRLAGFGGATGEVEIEIFARVNTTAIAAFQEIQEKLLLDILRAVEASGISLAPATPLAILSDRVPEPGRTPGRTA
jgi:MscS family membrane protein